MDFVPTRRGIAGILALLGAGAVLSAPVLLAPSRASAEVFTAIIPGVAAGGHDVVAYFTQGRPTRGNAQIAWNWNGATWRFASAANREAFMADPARYAPAYGGHCAWAAAQGYKAKGDPANWRIVEGRLFLNYDDRIQALWERNIASFVMEADRRWPGLRNG
jgi:YHS domain-containing protein